MYWWRLQGLAQEAKQDEVHYMTSRSGQHRVALNRKLHSSCLMTRCESCVHIDACRLQELIKEVLYRDAVLVRGALQGANLHGSELCGGQAAGA